MKDSTKMIKNTGTEYIHGLIRKNMQVGGTMVSNTDLVSSSLKKVSVKSAFGKMAPN